MTQRPDSMDPRRLSDDELDGLILTRLALVGVDLGVLPEDDPEAPADRARVLRAARTLLRSTVPALAAFRLDPQRWPPALYPPALERVSAEEDRGEA
jgi:hypothetical protein